MKKYKKILLIVLAVIILLVASFLLYPKITGQVAGNQKSSSSLKNPVSGLSDEQAEKNFDETYIRYLLYSLGLHNLKSMPFTGETPKIEIKINEETYNAEIIKGSIIVKKGESQNEDVIITTTRQEIIKSMREKEYLIDSFKNGLTSIKLVTTKTKVLAKGYANVYQQFTST